MTLLHKLFRKKKTVNQSSLTLLVFSFLREQLKPTLSIFVALMFLLTLPVTNASNLWRIHSHHFTFPDLISVSPEQGCRDMAESSDSHDGIRLFYYGSVSEITSSAFSCIGWITFRGAGKYASVRPTTGICPSGYIDDGTGQCIEIKLEKDRKQSHDICTGNPIIVATGNKFQTETDYQSQTPFGLNFVRFYNSSSNAVDKGIGNKWRHGFNRSLKLVDDQAQVARSTGQTFLFNLTDGDWVGDVDIPDTLIESTDEAGVRTGWQYQDSNDTIEVFNTTGQLLSATNRAGQSKTFSYDVTAIDGGDDNSDTLDKVVGFGGEEMSFSYDSSNRIVSMTDPEGNTYSYSYDAAGNLEKVTYPDNTPSDSLDNPTRTYHYENTSFPSHLTGLTDETGSRVTWSFDSEGRAISSELDGGVDKSTLDFSVADQVTVTNPLGKDTTYHFETLHGVKKVTQVEGHATASCAGANQNYTYDANGYIESKTDWKGNVTTYVHNARGLETSRTEASGTDEARTITTDWHDDYRLPIKITSPGQVTDFVYDDKGRLLSQAVHKLP